MYIFILLSNENIILKNSISRRQRSIDENFLSICCSLHVIINMWSEISKIERSMRKCLINVCWKDRWIDNTKKSCSIYIQVKPLWLVHIDWIHNKHQGPLQSCSFKVSIVDIKQNICYSLQNLTSIMFI